MDAVYDMIVLGGGPAGYTAALYAVRAGLRTLVLEQLAPGGQMALTAQIDNYPGFERGIDGFELSRRMAAGAERFGAESRIATVRAVELEQTPKRIHTERETLLARTVVLAMGAQPRLLGLPDEQALTGHGVHYCAACDGMFYRGKTVVVVGGGNSAAEDALLLSRLARRVILVHRGQTLRAARIYRDALEAAEHVEFRWNTEVQTLLHDGALRALRLRNRSSGAQEELACDALFVSIGRVPTTQLVAGALALDAQDYLIADETTRTALPGVYAAGDIRAKPLRQIVTAVADGATAAHFAEEYLALSE